MARSRATYSAWETFHIGLIILAYTSPWWVPKWWIVVAVGLLWLQFLVLGGCVINKHQYGDIKETVYERYIAKLGFKPNRTAVIVVARVIIPLAIVALAFYVQR